MGHEEPDQGRGGDRVCGGLGHVVGLVVTRTRVGESAAKQGREESYSMGVEHLHE